MLERLIPTRRDRTMEFEQRVQITRRLFSTHSLSDGAELGDGYCSNQSLNIRKIRYRSYRVQCSYKPPFAKPLFRPLNTLGLKLRIAYRNKLRQDRNITSGTKRFIIINWWKTSAPHSNNGLIGSLLDLPIAMSIFNSSSSNQYSNPDMLSLISLPSPKTSFAIHLRISRLFEGIFSQEGRDTGVGWRYLTHSAPLIPLKRFTR